MKIDLDLSYEYFGTDDFFEDLSTFNLTHEVIQLEGPAGGNPYIYLIGEEANLRAILNHWGYGAEDIQYFVEGE